MNERPFRYNDKESRPMKIITTKDEAPVEETGGF